MVDLIIATLMIIFTSGFMYFFRSGLPVKLQEYIPDSFPHCLNTVSLLYVLVFFITFACLNARKQMETPKPKE